MQQTPPTSTRSETHSPSVPGATLQSFAARATAEDIEQFLLSAQGTGDEMGQLLAVPETSRLQAGYGHTLREIFGQPYLWADTALRCAGFLDSEFKPLLRAGAFRSIALSGSGSSHYVGELVAPALQQRLGIPVRAVAAGDILSHGCATLPLPGPVLLVSIARSGNSPESLAAVRTVRREAPDSSFIHITCNPEGQLASEGLGDSRVHRLLLHPQTNDQSLVMTSSFTSLALGALSLGFANAPKDYLASANRICAGLHEILPGLFEFAGSLPFSDCHRAVFLGSGCQFGAAREAALKLTEMTSGRVVSMPETYLGLRHGPMAAIDAHTLLVCFTPTETRSFRYAADLVRELRAKELGRATILVGVDAAPRVVSPAHPDMTPGVESKSGEPFAAIANVVVGQAVGFFACRHHGLHPDAPSESSVITRVVPPFPIYEDSPSEPQS